MELKPQKPNIIYPILITFLVFIFSIFILSILGLAPKTLTFDKKIEKPKIQNIDESIDINSDLYIRPDRIVIDSVGINSIVNQPTNADVNMLDQALLSGAVHYPGSGSIQEGNIFIFGHSTNWKIVQNQAYKTFNNLDKVAKGDEIKIEADGDTYIYKVESVDLVDEDSALVSFDASDRTLTLSTCNTFGEKQERWVVKAGFYKQI